MALSLLKRLRGAWRGLQMQAADPVSDIRHPTAWLMSWALGRRTSSGIDVSAQSGLNLSAYFGAARAISEDVAKLPLKVYERLPRGKRPATEHWSYSILHDAPNQYQSSMNFREAMTFAALTWGNAYAQIVFDRGRPVAFGLPIHPGLVTPRFDEEARLYYEVRVGDFYTPTDGMSRRRTIDFSQEAMFHLRGPGGDGVTGWSIAQIGAESIGLTLAAQTMGSTFFGNGMQIGGVLEHPQTLSPQALENLKESLAAEYGGAENANKTMILEEGMKYHHRGIPPEDAQFLDTRKFQVEEIARWFRIPPHKIADLDNASFSNIEHQSLEYVTDTLQPWFTRWEQEIGRKLFVNEPAFFAEHVVLGLLRGDQVARANYYRTRFNMGSMSPNDIRELENENPIDDPAADQYYMQTAMAPIGQIQQQEFGNGTPPSSDDDDNDNDFSI